MLKKKKKTKEKDELLAFENTIDSFKLINKSIESLSHTSNDLKDIAQKLKNTARKLPPPAKRDLTSDPKIILPPPAKPDLSLNPKIVSDQRKEKKELELNGRKTIIVDAEDLVLILE